MHSWKRIKKGVGARKNLRNLLWNLVFFPRRIRFGAFRRKMSISMAYTRATVAQTNAKYDLFVTGSDQVFNLGLTGKDTAYFLDFAGEDKRKVSYAASFGVADGRYRELYRAYLPRMDFLSLRERSAVALAESCCSKRCAVSPDPVFLLTREEWDACLRLSPRRARRPYLLVYVLAESSPIYRLAAEIARERGLEIRVVSRALRPRIRNAHIHRNVGPAGFLRLLYNAGAVLSDSFHATAFSIRFQKQFYVCVPDALQKASGRITDLLAHFGLTARLCNDAIPKEDIAYDSLRDRMDAYRDEGTRYIREFLDAGEGEPRR